MKILSKFLSKKNILIIALLIVSTQTAMAQFIQVTGPSPVDGNTTHTYQYTDGFIHLNRQWIVVGGTVVSDWYTKFPNTYHVSVTWGNGTSGSITFNSNGVTYGFISVVINPSSPPSTPTNLSDENYIYNITPRIASTDVSVLANDEILESVTYFDGLGRPMQSNAIRGGSNEEDIITHIGYDDFGRQIKEYLPYIVDINGGAYKTDALSATNSFYDDSKYDADFPGMTTSTINPYSEKEFEASPLNRILKQAAPGYDWKLGNGHEIEFDYQSNDTLKVRYYKVTLSFANDTYTPTLVSSGDYNPEELSKTITYDENYSSGNNHSTEEFKDKQGRVVLKRTYNSGVEHDTYYVYDDYGNLTYVIPPKVTTSSISSTELSELCYQYKYDHRNRLIEKKIPGKGWEYIIYNDLDQPIMTQDQNLKLNNNWLFTVYDALGRVAYTGVVNKNWSRWTMQNHINTGGYTTFVNRTAQSVDINETTLFYDNYFTNGTYIPTNIVEVYTINYYDNYTFDIGAGVSETSYSVTPITNVKGLATGSKVRVLNFSPVKWITTVSYYDNKYRPIYVYSFNDYLGTTDKIKSSLDFTGTTIESTTTHARTNFSTITTVDLFDYDHMNRLLEHKQTINGGSEEVIVQNEYDELGQLVSKKVGNTITTPLQTVDYTYNVRGWLKQINNPASLGNDLFGFKLNYNTADHSGTKLYNGNIAETEWKTSNDNVLRWYRYGYDALNRITFATDNTVDTRYSLQSVAYDKNGNIMALVRKGHNNLAATTFGYMDILSYNYDAGNKLLKVVDTGSSAYGFKDGINTTTEYTYDGNGNMLKDLNKGMTSNILYNHLNLPTQVTLASGNIQYIYDATGIKLKKIVNETGQSQMNTEYAGNYIYENGSLKFFNHPEGYVDASGSGYEYVYQYKDHLGNIRLSYKNTGSNSSPTLQIQEENNYYPFGLKHKGYNGNIVSEHNWKFQGQELNKSLDYNMYEFELRHYDAALGRFVTTDPYEQFMSPYLAMGNNPVVSFDPDGGLCYDANGNSIACPDDDIYDDYRDNEDNHINILDEVVVGGNTIDTTSDLEFKCDGCVTRGEKLELAMNDRSDGVQRDLDELQLNLFNFYYRDGIRVDANGIALQSRGLIVGGNGAMVLIGGPASVALKSVSLPALKKLTIDIKHIVSGHTLGGVRASSIKSLFPSNMTATQIENAIKSAYKTAKKLKTQGNRVKVVGTSSDGMKIEMWVNKATKTIETAYPFK